jgi:hypothetical protein
VQIVSDIEHQGDLQIIGFIFALTMMVAAFVFGMFVLIFEALPRFR